MAKYTASPWGNLRGKLGGSVGGVWKGVNWARAHLFPRQPGTITKKRGSRDGCVRGIIYKPAQMNIRRAVFGMLGHIAQQQLTTLIHPVWQWLCDKRAYKLTGINLFLKTNTRRIYDSTWTGAGAGATFSGANLPDYLQMIISDGDLEASPGLTAATYSGATGIATLTWDVATFGNGLPADNAWVAVYRKPNAVEIGDYEPFGALFVVNTGAARSAGTATISIPTALAVGELIGFVFFNDTCANYSPSVSRQVA